MTAFSEEQRVLLQLLSRALFAAPLQLPETIDWASVFAEAAAQAVSPLAFSVAEPYLSESVCGQWRAHAAQAVSHSLRLRYEHGRLHRLLSSADIPYVVLKGPVSASYYPVPVLRMLGDVDFLVRQEDFPRAGKLLSAAGFQAVRNNVHEAHLAFSGEIATWEMHRSLAGIPSGIAGQRIHALLDGMIDSAFLFCDGDDSYCAPDRFHHGLTLLLHSAQHMTTSGIGLRHLADWAVFIGSVSDAEFSAHFAEPLRAIGLYRFAQILTLLCSDSLGLPPRAFAADACSAEDRQLLLADILSGGNFGHKRSDYLEEDRLLHMRAADGSRPSVLQSSIKVLNERACKAAPVLKKLPVLLPLGWMFVLCRRILRGFAGKQPVVHPLELYRKTSERKTLYKVLKLYRME